ncbi:hypothetical protein OF83DRAFT_1113989 [Amylostereum chailletii]|nr:hypothetical protein OF83DRAFT_1113989 [Amylostereum chailletii]
MMTVALNAYIENAELSRPPSAQSMRLSHSHARRTPATIAAMPCMRVADGRFAFLEKHLRVCKAVIPDVAPAVDGRMGRGYWERDPFHSRKRCPPLTVFVPRKSPRSCLVVRAVRRLPVRVRRLRAVVEDFGRRGGRRDRETVLGDGEMGGRQGGRSPGEIGDGRGPRRGGDQGAHVGAVRPVSQSGGGFPGGCRMWGQLPTPKAGVVDFDRG